MPSLIALFNMFLSELLYELDDINNGLRVGDQLYNSFAYADDVSLFASTVSGLQELIDTCFNKAIRDGKYLAPPHASAWQRSPH